MRLPEFRPYHCAHCKQTVYRQSTKAWIKSYCEKTGKNAHLTRLTVVAG